MKNIVLCFDRTHVQPELRNATNVEAVLHRLDDAGGQLTWYHSGASASRDGRLGALRWLEAAVDEARAAIIEAYQFLLDAWEPGDAIYMFGVGRGAYRTRELTRLLGTVGLLADRSDDLLGYALGHLCAPAHPAHTAGLAAGRHTRGAAGRET